MGRVALVLAIGKKRRRHLDGESGPHCLKEAGRIVDAEAWTSFSTRETNDWETPARRPSSAWVQPSVVRSVETEAAITIAGWAIGPVTGH